MATKIVKGLLLGEDQIEFEPANNTVSNDKLTDDVKTLLNNCSKFIVRDIINAGNSKTFSLPKITHRIYTLKIIADETNYALYDILVYASNDNITSIHIIPEENQNGNKWSVTINDDKTLTINAEEFAVISIVES